MRTISIIDEHARRNESTRARWEAMASHRARMMWLLAESRGMTGRSLCLMGTGNGNDIDLAQLAAVFERVVLIDLDDAALARSVQRLSKDESTHVELHGSIDLTGILPVLETWRKSGQPSDADLSALIELARRAPRPHIGTFDVVASTCVLSQLIDSIYLALPPDHPRCIELVMAVRDRHLEILLELVNPGGVGVLVTDFVATETAPEIARLDDADFPQVALQWIAQRNFFTGTNPFAIRDLYKKLHQGTLVTESVQVLGPWRWDIGAKQLAVCAVTFRRRA